ncbi:MAG: branched-chain amino acid ABC transporter permease [Chromatiales bacterium]|jgi:branched-chain amino acid transport system permease protein|nr:branched-chain amino acid ABC transporter permease [Chromatiales bacterium]
MAKPPPVDKPLPPNPAGFLTVGGISLPAWKKSWSALAVIAALALTFWLEDFSLFQLTNGCIYAIAIMGLMLLTGFNGQFSLGHSAFFAVGAYTAAIMMDQWQVPYFWTLVPAGFMCLIVGFLFGLPAVRLGGLYLALATFALAVATPQLLKYDAFEHWTGGVQGLDLDKPVSPFASLSDDQWIYLFTLVVLAIMVMVAWNLVRGRSGRAMVAIRDNPLAAQTMGINTALYKSLTFGVSGLFTGVAGALSAIAIQFVAPDSFTFILAISFLVGLVVGGLVSIPGAIFGGMFILYVPNLTEDFEGLAWTAYGIVLIVAVYVMPMGAAGLIKKTTAKMIQRPQGGAPDSAKAD